MMLRVLVGSVVLAATSTLSAQSPALKVKEEKAGMLKQAKITPEAALATASAKVPGTTLKSAEIEKEDGKLLYVFSFTKSGTKGEDEVAVDAMTGALHKVEREAPEDEAREAAEDAAKAKAKAKAAAAKAAPAGTATKPTKPPVA
ncbi:MAG: PepSY domain-containing protein [Gemmatimonadaceae bacterium]|jgi:hypothetical protein